MNKNIKVLEMRYFRIIIILKKRNFISLAQI